MKKEQLYGFLFVIAAAVIYGFMPLMAKFIYAGGCTSESLVLYRGILSLPIVYFLMKKNKQVKLNKKIVKDLFILTLIGVCGTQLLLFMSYDYISIGLATTLHFSYPIFVLLGCAIFFREKLSPLKILCVGLSTAGIVCFYTPGGNISTTGLLIAFVSGITFAFYIVFLEKTALKDMPPFQLCFHVSLFTGFIMLAYTIPTGTFTYDFEPKTWILMFFFSFLINGGATVFFQQGVKHIGSQKSAILCTLEPLTSILLGIVVFNDILTFKAMIGIVLILIAVILIALLDKPKNGS
ncbi:MAG: DMT family transporter [Anaerovoracaceae bacterium]